MKEWKTVFLFLLVLLMAAPLWAAPVPDTGQTKCYNDSVEIPCPSPGEDYYGQDANYTINPMSYTKLDSSGNALDDSATTWSTVKDHVTGLTWEVKTNKDNVANFSDPHDADNLYTWYDSNPDTNGGYTGTPGNGTDTEDFLKALNDANYGGHSDWRLPTIKELGYLIDRSVTPETTINMAYFPNTAASWYWSSTTDAYYTSYAWRVKFFGGYDGNYYKHSGNYVRAVRGGQATSSYSDNKDGTVTDTSTGLTWQQETPDDTITWQQALAYCEGLSLGGHTDWRLPTEKELRSLLDYSKYNPAINLTYFPDTVESLYWSSTTFTDKTYVAWAMAFGNGDGNGNDKPSYGYVRAVRSGPPGSTDDCISTIDENLVLHIPYATYIHPLLGPLYFYTDMVYELDLYDIIFKLTTLEVYTETLPYSCTPATLSSSYDLHVPDVLLPDGITHVWLDLRLDTTRSTEYIYFLVTNFGDVAN